MSTPTLKEYWNKIQPLLNHRDDDLNMAQMLLESLDEDWLYQQCAQLIRIEEIPNFSENNLSYYNDTNIKVFWKKRLKRQGSFSEGFVSFIRLLLEKNVVSIPNIEKLILRQPSNAFLKLVLHSCNNLCCARTHSAPLP